MLTEPFQIFLKLLGFAEPRMKVFDLEPKAINQLAYCN